MIFVAPCFEFLVLLFSCSEVSAINPSPFHSFCTSSQEESVPLRATVCCGWLLWCRWARHPPFSRSHIHRVVKELVLVTFDGGPCCCGSNCQALSRVGGAFPREPSAQAFSRLAVHFDDPFFPLDASSLEPECYLHSVGKAAEAQCHFQDIRHDKRDCHPLAVSHGTNFAPMVHGTSVAFMRSVLPIVLQVPAIRGESSGP